MLKIDDKALYEIIDSYTREAGVRGLERLIAKICRKAARIIAEGMAENGKAGKVTVTLKIWKNFWDIRSSWVMKFPRLMRLAL